MKSKSLQKLIEEWIAFCDQDTNADLSDFAVWLLNKEGSLLEDSELLKFKLFELTRIIELKSKRILSKPGDLQAFKVLSIIERKKNPVKLEVVKDSLLETSTGFYIIKDLFKKGLVKESMDPKDRRVVRIKLTTEGKTFVATKRKELQKVAVLEGLTSQSDKKLFAKLLSTIHLTQKNLYSNSL
jgi:DNA-binding MarR family transcriptional regulator